MLFMYNTLTKSILYIIKSIFGIYNTLTKSILYIMIKIRSNFSLNKTRAGILGNHFIERRERPREGKEREKGESERERT